MSNQNSKNGRGGYEAQLEQDLEDGDIASDHIHDRVSLASCSTEGDSTLRPRKTLREILLKHMHSTKFQVALIALVVLDTLLVITELLLDLELAGQASDIPFILHTISLGLLSVFLVEVCFKIYALQLDFFRQKGDVFDALVVVVAIILDSVYLHAHDAHSGAGLIIVLRLWRVVRIQNSMVLSVRAAGERKVNREREARLALEMEVDRYRQYCAQQERYCQDLRDLLHQNGIEHKEQCMSLPPDLHRIDVVAEVNPKIDPKL